MSWIHIFSQFTSEALLIEASGLFLLLCLYTAFWILRKRRYGAVEADLPSGPVKAYLNELIFNTEQLRAQLFGLMASKDIGNFVPQNRGGLSPMGGASPGGPLSADAQSQIELLQLKINDQTKQIATLTQEKADIEKTASEASASAAANAGNSGDSQALKDLQGKYAELENRLQEYSVIEDDLVNLGRLMRENTKLKELLTEKGIPLPNMATGPLRMDAPVSAPPPPPDPKVEAVVDAITAQMSAAQEPQSAPTPAAPTPAAPTPAAPAAPAGAAGATAAPATPAPPPAAPNPPGAPPPETDLVEEFEKLLDN